MFRSPTCTAVDRLIAEKLAAIADIDIESYAKQMFDAGSNLGSKSAKEIFYQDFKKFSDNDINFGVGQISSMDGEELKEIREKITPVLKNECERHGNEDFKIFFMLTNILEESTTLLYYGEGAEELARTAFHKEPDGDVFQLTGMVSRKKQLIPPMMEAVSVMKNIFE